MDSFEKYIGHVFDQRYRIIKIIGIGGMAVVFEAHDNVLNRKVAIKMLKDEIATDTQAVKRFINESKAVAMLSHPNIVKIYDISVKDNLKYIVMERVEGITLKSYMQKKGILPLREQLSYTEQILRALDHAHSKGIIHRDIKPQNILLLKNGKIKVTDFGIAKLPNAETVTMTDKAIGTVYYISPEQASGKPIDPRSDLYSLGILMYEMATGQLPFMADTPVSVALMQVTNQPKSPHEIVPGIPQGLEQIILVAIEKNPDRRFQSAEKMLRYVEQLKSDPGYIFKTRKRDATADSQPSAVIEPPQMKKKHKFRQSRSMFPIISGVASAFLIVLGISGYYILNWFIENNQNNKSTSITVPALVGSVYSEELVSQLDSSIYKIEIINTYDKSYPENTIIDQDPSSGERRKVVQNQQYCTITLTVSRGAKTIVLPDYSVMDYRKAELAIEALGLKYDTKQVANDYMDVGYVISTSPEAGASVTIGSTVTIYASAGITPTMVTVPDFLGYTESAAYAKMKDNSGTVYLKPGKITREYSDTVAEGRIISQSITPNVKVVRGSTINFVISLGREEQETTMPVDTEPETTDTHTETTGVPEETTGSEPADTAVDTAGY